MQNWGFYSNVSHTKRLRETSLESVSLHDTDQKDDQDSQGQWQCRLSWAKMIQKVYKVDPLLCTFCGSEVKILSFITQYKTMKAILNCMGLPAQKPKPLAHSPPLFKDTVYVPCCTVRTSATNSTAKHHRSISPPRTSTACHPPSHLEPTTGIP